MKMIFWLLIIGVFLLAGASFVSGAGWSGYVLNTSSAGIDASNVTAVFASNNDYVNSTMTNVFGFFNITITDNKKVKLISSKSGYLTDTSQDLPKITSYFTLPFNITLDRAQPGNITGRITNTTGSAIEGANISAIQGSSTIKSVLSDSNGDYALIDLLDGTYTIGVDVVYYTPQNTTNVVLLPNSTTSGINFSLSYETIPPIISDIGATLITSSEAVIIWQTDEQADSNVYYRKDNVSILTSGSLTLTTSHLIRLSSLSSSTLYYYNVSSCDFVGNCNTSGEYNFTTQTASTSVEEGDSSGGGGGGSRGVSELITTTGILAEGARMTIKVEAEIHYITIVRLTNTDVTINISSTPQQATLQIGEEKKFEITDDDYYDILVKLNNIKDDKANITVSYIHEEISEIPEQLLDIKLNLVKSLIRDISELVAVVRFENFGAEPVHVSFLFTILDKDGKDVYTEDGSIDIEIEKVLRKSFEDIDINLEENRYTLILTTLHDVDIVEEFREEFEISPKGIGITGKAIEFVQGERKWYLIGIILVIVLFSYIIFSRYIKHKRKKRRKEHEVILKKIKDFYK